MADEARLHEILDIYEQAVEEGDTATAEKMKAAYAAESQQAATPAGSQAQAEPHPQPKFSSNPLAVAGGGLDALATLVSGAFAQPVSGLVGMGAAALDQIPGVDIDAPAVIDKTQQFLTHEPMTDNAEMMLGAAAKPFEYLAKGADKAGQFTLDATGSTLAATAVRTLIEGAPDLVGLKGLSAAGAAVKGSRRAAPTAEGRLLQSEGMDLKRSQMGSGVMQSLDRGSDAVLGESAFDARQADQFNAAALKRAGAAPGEVRVSPAVLKDLKDDVSKSYNDLHARRSTPLDQQLDTDLNQVMADAASDGLDASDPLARRVIKQVENFRALAAANGGSVPGVAGQRIRTKLGELGQSSDGFVAHFARNAREAMDNSWERAAPVADRVKMAETRARFRMHDQLSGVMQGNATGNLSPNKLYSRVDKPTNRSAGLHDLARAGKAVLPDNLANSGTAARGADIGKIVGMVNPNRWGDLARTVAGAGGGRFLNESPNIGAKAGALARSGSAQTVAASSAGHAALDEQRRLTDEYLKALGL